MKIGIKLNRLDIPCLIRPLIKISSLPIVNTQKPILIPIFRSNAIFSASQGAISILAMIISTTPSESVNTPSRYIAHLFLRFIHLLALYTVLSPDAMTNNSYLKDQITEDHPTIE